MRRDVQEVLAALAIAVAILLFLPSIVPGNAPPSAAGPGLEGRATAAAPPSPHPVPRPAPSAAGSFAGPITVTQIHQDLQGRGVPSGDLHLPALFAEGDRTASPVAPIYSSAPAPMGVADIGLQNVGGNLAGYRLSTVSAEGTASLTNAQSVYVDGNGPDTFGLELGSVLTNVTLFGNSTFEFWTQDFASYTSSSGTLSFGDNLWNFSGLAGTLSPNALFAHGPNGSLVAPVFYYALGPTFTIHYPFVVTFYLNATEIADRPAVYFNYTVSNTTYRASGSFDHVVFNSSIGAPAGPAPPAAFEIDGTGYDPVGLINDIELTLVGDSNGATTTFFQINATLSIAYWNATAGEYLPVPSAVNAGADTGETSEGLASYYTGPVAVAHLGPGPSFLSGLWNSTTAPGARTVAATVAPAAVLLLVNPGASRNASSAQWVPSSPTGTTTFVVPDTGPFFLDCLLSEYDPVGVPLPATGPNGTFTVTESLGKNTSLGIYTPIIAWGNAELATFAASGNGTAAQPYLLYRDEPGALDPEFTQWNDFEYPVFPGLLLIGTTAYTMVSPPAFHVDLPVVLCGATPPLCVGPVPNDLQIELWNVHHLVLANATITGWLSPALPSTWPVGEVIFWASTDDLVARITFADQGSSLALYGGGANVVWGNTFEDGMGSLVDPAPVWGWPDNQSGIWEAESGDLVYNNNFSVPSPAYTPAYDPFPCGVACTRALHVDQWNVSRESAAASRTVLGVVLSGSVIGTSYQGGNFWSNYGTPSDPYGELPYVDRPAGTLPPGPGQIPIGGDYVPLVPFALYSVTIQETGLPSTTPWSLASSLVDLSTSTASVVLSAPNGSYPFTVTWPTSLSPPYVLEGPSEFTVAGANVTVDLTFVPEANVTFAESGLLTGTWWTLTLNGTGLSGPRVTASPNASVSLLLGPGNYSFAAASSGYDALPAFGNLSITNGSAVHVTIDFTGLPVPLWLAFLVPTCAQVSIDAGAASARTCGTFRANVMPDVAHLVEVEAPGFYPYFVNVTLFVGAPAYPINVSMTPRPAAASGSAIGPLGTVLVGLLAALVVVLLGGVILLYRRKHRRPGPPPLVPVPVPGGGATIGPAASGAPEEAWREDDVPPEPGAGGPRAPGR